MRRLFAFFCRPFFARLLASWKAPFVLLHVDAALGHLDAFGLEEFSLQGSVRLADEKFPTCTNDAMPGNSLSGRAASHGATGSSCATRQVQGSGYGPIR